MEIKTGYFAYAKKYEELGYKCISIARSTPKWFRGIRLTQLAPTYDTLNRYKGGLLDEEHYKDEYLAYLSSVDVQGVLRPFKDDKIILLCYEKSDSFCHRHLLAKYLGNKFGLDVKELEIVK